MMRGARRVAFLMLSLGMLGALVGARTHAALSSTTGNPSDDFAAGTVYISDNDAGSTLLSLSSAMPGQSSTGCIKATYGGSLSAGVHLYASVAGALAPYLTLTITRGTDSAPSFSSCTNFTADTTNYGGNGAGVIYSGALNAFPSTYAGGVVDPANCGSPPCSAQTWVQNDTRSYKLVITLPTGAGAGGQGNSATATFTWEAQNQ
jgi:hypothetical protein